MNDGLELEESNIEDSIKELDEEDSIKELCVAEKTEVLP